jgi:hypothetical protein
MHAPAIVVVAVDVEDLLPLDAKYTRENALGQSCAQHNDIVLRGNLVGHGGGSVASGMGGDGSSASGKIGSGLGEESSCRDVKEKRWQQERMRIVAAGLVEHQVPNCLFRCPGLVIRFPGK